MKKIGFFGLAGIVVGLLLPSAAFAQYYYPYDNNYRYDDDVVCVPEQQRVAEDERAYFIAYGGDGDYDWSADGHTYRDRGNRFSYEFDNTGTERVTVRSDGESDTCTVRVVDRDDYYTHPTYPAYPIYPAAPIVAQPTITTTYIPQGLPNTGFPPVSSAAFAFAAVLLLTAGLVLTPYAKKLTAAIR